MTRYKLPLTSFLVLLTIVFLSTDVRAGDLLGKLKGDYSNHPALQAESFNVEIKDYKQGFLSLYVPKESDRASSGRDVPYSKKWKNLMKKAESLALENTEVRDVTWFVKGDAGSEDRLYIDTRHYFSGWTAHFHIGAGQLSWAGDTNWDSDASEDIWSSSFDFGRTSWPVLLHFTSTGTTTRHALTGGSGDRYTVSESSYGVRKYFSVMGLYPYLSAGGTFFTIHADLYDYNNSNGNNVNVMMFNTVTSAKGYYVNLGIMKKLGPVFEIGIDARAVRGGIANVELIENDTSYNSATLFIGAGF